MIANSGHDEHGKYSGGTAGDQTGTEWAVLPWYNRPWTCILRHPDKTVRELIAQLGEEAAHNDLIAKITTPCEADCSAGVISIVRAAGELLGVNNLKHLSATYTGNMRTGFRTAGFQVLTASKYLTSDKYLRRGDILLNDAHHTAINLTNGTAVVPITRAALEKSGVEAIAREVIAGKWGNGSDRKKRLEAAGYSYAAVQAAVNRLLKS